MYIYRVTLEWTSAEPCEDEDCPGHVNKYRDDFFGYGTAPSDAGKSLMSRVAEMLIVAEPSDLVRVGHPPVNPKDARIVNIEELGPCMFEPLIKDN